VFYRFKQKAHANTHLHTCPKFSTETVTGSFKESPQPASGGVAASVLAEAHVHWAVMKRAHTTATNLASEAPLLRDSKFSHRRIFQMLVKLMVLKINTLSRQLCSYSHSWEWQQGLALVT